MVSKFILASLNGFLQSVINTTWIEWVCLTVGGIAGWFVGVFSPAFPLVIIATLFVLYDAWSAYELDKRVHQRYPDRVKRKQAKFVSYKFRSVIPTLIERMVIIILAYCVQRWIFIDIYVPLSYIVAGIVCAEQLLSIAENKASCRLPGDRHARIWNVLAQVLIDKTERHFDVDLSIVQEKRKEDKTDVPYNDSDVETDSNPEVQEEQKG